MKFRPITPLVPQKAGVPSGGTIGQPLVKASSKNFDTGWGLTPTTVANLPITTSPGQLATVTDGTAALAWGATVTGGAATSYLVWWNGANWTVLGK